MATFLSVFETRFWNVSLFTVCFLFRILNRISLLYQVNKQQEARFKTNKCGPGEKLILEVYFMFSPLYPSSTLLYSCCHLRLVPIILSVVPKLLYGLSRNHLLIQVPILSSKQGILNWKLPPDFVSNCLICTNHSQGCYQYLRLFAVVFYVCKVALQARS